MRSQRALWITVVVLVTGPNVARADDYADFRIPANKSLSWTADIGAFGSRFALGRSGIETRRGGLNGSVFSSFRWLSDSDPTSSSMDGEVGFGGSRSRGSDSFNSPGPSSFVERHASDRQRTISEQWFLSIEHRRYPWTIPIGVSLDLSGRGFYDQYWISSETDMLQNAPGFNIRTVTQRHAEDWRYQHIVTARVATGIGRVRNATGIYEARVFEQRLLESGAIIRALTPSARKRLAELMYARTSLIGIRDRPAKETWRAIERILEDDGALGPSGLGVFSIFRAAEPHVAGAIFQRDGVPRSPVMRLTGSFAGLVLESRHSHIVNRFDEGEFFQETLNDSLLTAVINRRSTRETGDLDEVLAGLMAEHHRPFGMRWQADGSSELLIPIREQDNWLEVSSALSMSWLAADRWLGSIFLAHAWLDDDRTQGPTHGDRTDWSYGIAVTYYLENRLGLRLSASESQRHTREVLGGPPLLRDGSFSRNGNLFFNFSYRFKGSFEAPGLYPAR
ncbi:MAG TPA: hypothetical protein VEY91_07495 [Candidatus Limnocylindria bacterium]|nr:hypothetical protein [Candidatus Limnocylindria bacterium]